MEARALTVDVVLQQRLCRLKVVETPIHWLVVSGVLLHFLLVKEILEVSATHCFLHGNSHSGVKAQHGLYHLNGRLACAGKQLVPVGLRCENALAEKGPCGSIAWQPVQFLLHGSAQDTDDLLDLVQVILACKDWLAGYELAEDASNSPNVYGHCVFRRQQHNLRRSVPPCDNIVSPTKTVLCICGKNASEPKVTDLEITILVHQKIRRFQITVHHADAVQVDQASEDLMNKVLVMLLRERLFRIDHLVQVSFHEIGDNVDVLKVRRFGRVHVEDPNDVFMVELPQQLHLSQDSFAINKIPERVSDLLDCTLFACLLVFEGGHAPVCPRPNLLDQLHVNGYPEG
mmetsp:Transcript_60288/g.140419  ORF Transcript_60288/g.140419 Transcript_60288/m.140419 type:complete len:344 (+) Transcript_60288:233-1264(+)